MGRIRWRPTTPVTFMAVKKPLKPGVTRKAILLRVKKGEGTLKIAREMKLAVATVSYHLKTLRDKGLLPPAPATTKKKPSAPSKPSAGKVKGSARKSAVPDPAAAAMSVQPKAPTAALRKSVGTAAPASLSKAIRDDIASLDRRLNRKPVANLALKISTLQALQSRPIGQRIISILRDVQRDLERLG